MSMEALRNSLQPCEITAVTRLEDHQDGDQHSLLAVVLKDRVEINGVPVGAGVVASFGLWSSVAFGRLPEMDVALLQRNYPTYFWAPWPTVVQEAQRVLENAERSAVLLACAEIIGLIARRDIAEPFRKKVETNLGFLFDVMSLQVSPLAGAKRVKHGAATVVLMAAVYQWTARRIGLSMPWVAEFTEQWLPGGSPLSLQAYTRHLRDWMPRLREGCTPQLPPCLRASHAAQIPPAPSPGDIGDAEDSDEELLFPGSTSAPSPELLMPSPTPADQPPPRPPAQPDVFLSLNELLRSLPSERLPFVLTLLHRNLRHHEQAARFLSYIEFARSPTQVADLLVSHPWP
eukprot:EG_transcript_18801